MTATPSDGTEQCCSEHRQTMGDESPRGEHHPDDRTELAYVYDGLALQAILFKEDEITRYRDETPFTVTLTPAGECRVNGKCAAGTEGDQ